MIAKQSKVPSGPRGAEVTYASLSVRALAVGERRLEGETYLTGGYAVRTQIESSGAPFAPLSQLAKVWQPSRLKGIAVAREHGVPFLTATQVFDIRPAPRKWLAPSRTPDFQDRFIQRGWILVTCSGNVGDTIVSYDAHSDTLISHDLLRLQPFDADSVGYIYSFLRCRYGRAVLRSSHYGSIIKHLEAEHLHDVPVPIVKNGLRRALDEQIKEVFRIRDEAFHLVQEAESLYAAALGIERVHEPNEAAYVVSASEMFVGRRRLDGYHYNPAAEAALQALQASGKSLVPLYSVVMRVFGVPRFKHIYTQEGTPYLDSEDIFKINPELTKFIPQISKKDASSYFVHSGWILMACSGQLYGLNGNAVLSDSWHEKKIVSNHVIRIAPTASGIRPGYLQMVLTHPLVGRPLVLRLAFGTEVPEIAADDLRSFPVPRLGTAEDDIANLVERASALRMKADHLENEAVASMERYMETVHRVDASMSPKEDETYRETSGEEARGT